MASYIIEQGYLKSFVFCATATLQEANASTVRFKWELLSGKRDLSAE